MSEREKDLVCLNKRDGGGCGKDEGAKIVHLVVYGDDSSELLCESCIRANKDSVLMKDTRVFRITSDITSEFTKQE